MYRDRSSFVDDVRQHPVHVGLVDDDGGVAQLGRLERQLVEQALHHGVQPAGADVLGVVVDAGGEVGDPLHRVRA